MSVTKVEVIPALLTTETLLKDRWEPLKKIGGGGFGEIYKARDRETNKVSRLGCGRFIWHDKKGLIIIIILPVVN